MKKIRVLLIMATLMFAYNAEAQKSGILQKDHYGAFTGNDWEDFLAGKRANDFEKKSNVTLASYLGIIQQFVTGELKEPTIASAVMNSTVVSFPEGSDVYTADADGNWKTRKAYPGERGYMHTQTRICWLSFSCGNLVKSIFGKPVTPSAPPAGAPDPALMVKYIPPGSTNNNTINVNPPGNNNGSELTWNVGYGVYSMGRNDRQNDFIVDASLYKMIQDAKQCCGGGATTTPVQQISYATPSMVMQAAPAQQSSTQTIIYKPEQQKLGFGQTFGGQLLANTGGEILGTYAVRGIDALTRRRVVYTTTPAPVYQNTFPVVYGTGGGFQGSSDPRYTSTGTIPVNTSAAASIFPNSGVYDNGNFLNHTQATGGGLVRIGN